MKFKMRGANTSMNKLVKTRQKMRNDYNFSLFRDAKAYKRGVLGGFGDKTIENRFERDCIENNFNNEIFTVAKWIVVFVACVYNKNTPHTITDLIIMPILPTIIDFVCLKKEKALIWSRIYYVVFTAMFNPTVFSNLATAFPFMIFNFLMSLMAMTSFLQHVV